MADEAPSGEPGAPTLDVDANAGGAIVTAALVGTAAYAVVAVAATIAPDGFGGVLAAVALALFAVGIVTFLWSYAVAVGRSRTDAMGIGGLYFLSGSAPRAVRRRLMGALAAEVVVAVATSSIRPFTVVAFGILVPMYGLALAGLWGARHGAFPSRSR